MDGVIASFFVRFAEISVPVSSSLIFRSDDILMIIWRVIIREEYVGKRVMMVDGV